MTTNGIGSLSDPLRSLTKHSKYYIPGADLCFLVDNVHFRVHRYFFERESGYFAGKLTTPASPGEEPQGTQDSNAILLENVTVEHFATFLWVFYNPRYSLYDASVADWEIILGLAVRWGFAEVKNLAVRELEKKTEISDSKRVKLYQENDVDKNVLILYYAALCEREAYLTREEAEDLGMDTVVRIAACREEIRASRLAGVKTPFLPTISGTEVHDVVREVFRTVPAILIPNNDDTGNPSGTPMTPGKKVNGNGNIDSPDLKADLKKRGKK
jgi:hypothetical protein